MRDKGKLLSTALAEEIRLLVPPRIQLVDEWSLAYSLEQNGVSLATLYKKSEDYLGKRGGFVLVVRDSGGGVCSTYLSQGRGTNNQRRSLAHTFPTRPTPLHISTAMANVSCGARTSSPPSQILRQISHRPLRKTPQMRYE